MPFSHSNRIGHFDLTRIAFVSVAMVWLGLLLGVSFFAAPIKFQAPGVNFEALLAVGKVTFTHFIYVERGIYILLAISALVILFNNHVDSFATSLIVICIGMLLFVQQTFLFPILDERLNLIIQGEHVSKSYHHHAYILSDIAKMIFLISIPVIFMLKPNHDFGDVT